MIDGSNFNLFYNFSLSEDIKTALNNEEIDVMQLKNSGKLTPEDWVTVTGFLAPLENNADLFYKEFHDKHVDEYDKEYYEEIVGALLSLLEKQNHVDKININFKSAEAPVESLEEKLTKYQGLCVLENSERIKDSLERMEYAKDTKKKKAFKVPDVEHERNTKAFQKTPEINVLFFDKKAEFITRNKVLEAFLKLYHNKFELEIDSKTIFKVYNEFYDANMDETGIFNKIQTFKFDIHDIVEQPEIVE